MCTITENSTTLSTRRRRVTVPLAQALADCHTQDVREAVKATENIHFTPLLRGGQALKRRL